MNSLLVIDEDEDSCMLLKRVLNKQGYHVASCAKVQDALAWIKDNTADLTIVNAGKHGEKARESLAVLKSAGIKGNNIVLSTSPGSLDKVRKEFADKVLGVLYMPTGLEKLQATVKSYLPQ